MHCNVYHEEVVQQHRGHQAFVRYDLLHYQSEHHSQVDHELKHELTRVPHKHVGLNTCTLRFQKLREDKAAYQEELEDHTDQAGGLRPGVVSQHGVLRTETHVEGVHENDGCREKVDEGGW
jgi:hypothetical protein